MGLKDYLIKNKVKYSDKLGNITYSISTGTALDINAGLDFWGIVVSRTYGNVMNYLTGDIYGKWREKLFRETDTKKESHWFRKYLVDLGAFNSFQTPLYMGSVALGSLAQNVFEDGNFDINWDKVVKGGWFLFRVSPLVSLTMNLWMDGTRKIFGIKSAIIRAHEKKV